MHACGPPGSCGSFLFFFILGMLLSLHLCFCARSVLSPHQEAAHSTQPTSQPELEDADPPSQAVSAPSPHSGSEQPAAPSQQRMAAADTTDIDMTHIGTSDSAQATEPSASAAAPGPKPASTSKLHPGAVDSSKQKQGSAKCTYIAKGHRLPNRSCVPKSFAFPDAGSIKAALADAWSSESDVGKQLAALHELFGDSLLPYVPMLPCLSLYV